jgi:hypothetical protein
MAESSKSSSDKANNDVANNTQPSNGRSTTFEEMQSMMRAARARASNSHQSTTVYSSVSPAVAMGALRDIEEEALREDLVNPETSEEERAQIRERLAGIQVQRRWHDMVRTLEPSAPNSHSSAPSASAPSKTGKGPSR